MAFALDDLGFNFANLLVHQIAPVFLAGDDRFARFLDARGAQRVGLPGKAEGRLGLFPGLEQRLIGPLRRNGRVRIALVEVLNCVEGDRRAFAENPIEGPQNLRAYLIRHKPLPSTFEKMRASQPTNWMQLADSLEQPLTDPPADNYRTTHNGHVQ